MRPTPFALAAPESLEEALALLADAPPDARILAGGQSLVPSMRLRRVRPPLLVDVNRLDSLAFIEERDGGVAIGALTRQAAVLSSDLAAERAPLAVAALRESGYAAIRARGTIGGAIAHGDPAGDLPLALVALGGTVRVTSQADGRRTLDARDLYRAPLVTALASGELLTEVRFPAHDARACVYERASAGVGAGRAIVNVAVVLNHAGGRVEHAAVAIGGAGATPRRAAGAERALDGQEVDMELIETAAETAAAECDPIDDHGASAGYRRQLVRALVRRALARAAEGTP